MRPDWSWEPFPSGNAVLFFFSFIFVDRWEFDPSRIFQSETFWNGEATCKADSSPGIQPSTTNQRFGCSKGRMMGSDLRLGHGAALISWSTSNSLRFPPSPCKVVHVVTQSKAGLWTQLCGAKGTRTTITCSRSKSLGFVVARAFWLPTKWERKTTFITAWWYLRCRFHIRASPFSQQLAKRSKDVLFSFNWLQNISGWKTETPKTWEPGSGYNCNTYMSNSSKMLLHLAQQFNKSLVGSWVLHPKWFFQTIKNE